MAPIAITTLVNWATPSVALQHSGQLANLVYLSSKLCSYCKSLTNQNLSIEVTIGFEDSVWQSLRTRLTSAPFSVLRYIFPTVQELLCASMFWSVVWNLFVWGRFSPHPNRTHMRTPRTHIELSGPCEIYVSTTQLVVYSMRFFLPFQLSGISGTSSDRDSDRNLWTWSRLAVSNSHSGFLCDSLPARDSRQWHFPCNDTRCEQCKTPVYGLWHHVAVNMITTLVKFSNHTNRSPAPRHTGHF
jgi:hypothetical protein